jgi:inosine-uridine nucleoside N-ribohydrolase
VLYLCGFPEIPVVAGTDGTGGRESRDLFWHELKNQTFERQDWNNEENEHFCGHTSISELVNQATSDGQKVAVLCLSSLQDISEYLSEQDDEILQSRFAKFVSQGGYEIDGGFIKPDMKTMNNKFHPEAAKYFTDRLSKLNIRSEAWGKEVAVAAALN